MNKLYEIIEILEEEGLKNPDHDIDSCKDIIKDSLNVFTDKSSLINWINEADCILEEALEQYLIDNGLEDVEFRGEEFNKMLIDEYIRQNDDLLCLSESIYVVLDI